MRYEQSKRGLNVVLQQLVAKLCYTALVAGHVLYCYTHGNIDLDSADHTSKQLLYLLLHPSASTEGFVLDNFGWRYMVSESLLAL